MEIKTVTNLKVGDKWGIRGDEIIVRINENENVLVTEGYNKNACRWEFNFYDLYTGKHRFTKSL
jgi:hypothetical protein